MLRHTRVEDIPRLYALECDAEVAAMAGIKPRTREMFFAKWEEVLRDPNVRARVIEVRGPGGAEFAGTINVTQADGRNMVGYLIARSHWGRGVASRALEALLKEEPRRPLHANVIRTNPASIRVLEKNGFRLREYCSVDDNWRYVAGERAQFELGGEGRDGDPVISLRATRPGDVGMLFELHSDPEANAMAGTKPRTREAYDAVWEKIFKDPKINSRVIEIETENGREIAGGVSVFQAPREGASDGSMLDCLGYWIAKKHWGKGLASRAVAKFLREEEERRPLHATIAAANARSRRVLEKCGFRIVGRKMGEETERYVGCEVVEWELGAEEKK